MEELALRILAVFAKYNIHFSSMAHKRLAYDVKRLGWDTVKFLAMHYSPSQLGRMGFLGVRRLAQLRRDNPQLFETIVKELEEVIKW